MNELVRENARQSKTREQNEMQHLSTEVGIDLNVTKTLRHWMLPNLCNKALYK